MTVSAPLQIPEAWTPPAITRSTDHRYTFGDITYPGCTSIIDLLGASFYVASNWGANHAAEAAVRLIPELPAMLEAVGPAGVAKAIASRESWGEDPSGSILGTQVHELVSLFLQGKPLPAMTLPQSKRVNHFIKWWDASGWTLRLTEAMVVRPADDRAVYGWGGTFDILAYDRDGKTVCADIKTGNVYPKVALQLAGYGMAKWVQPEGATRVYPMPLPDRNVVIHLTEGGKNIEKEVVVGTAENMAFMACLEIWNWNESMKGKRL